MSALDKKTQAFLELSGLTLEDLWKFRSAHIFHGGSIPLEIEIPIDLMVYGMAISFRPVKTIQTRCGTKTRLHGPIPKKDKP